MQGLLPSLIVAARALMPALEPLGRAIEHVVSLLLLPLVTMVSPVMPVDGLTASQLYILFVGLVLSKCLAMASRASWVVSEPTPTTSVSFGSVPDGGSARAGPIPAPMVIAAVATTTAIFETTRMN